MRNALLALLLLFSVSVHGQFTNVYVGTANAGAGDDFATAFAKLNFADNWLKSTLGTVSNLTVTAGGSAATKAETNQAKVWGITFIGPTTNLSLTPSRAMILDSAGRQTNSATTDTELGYVSGVTSPIQTQIGLKLDASAGTASGLILSDGTASRAMVFDSSKRPTASATTATELGYVSGVTSALQTQINAKASQANLTIVSNNLPFINIKDPAYGATGLGVASDTAAIQAALTAAGAAGNAVFAPPGTYLITNTLTIPSNVRLIGAGIGSTTFKGAAGAFVGPAAYAGIAMVGVTNASVENVSWNGFALGNLANGILVSISTNGVRSSNCMVLNCSVDLTNAHIYGIWNYKSDSTKVLYNRVNGHTLALDNSSEQNGIETYGGFDFLAEGNSVFYVGANGLDDISDVTNNVANRSGHRFIGNYVYFPRVGFSATTAGAVGVMGMTNVLFAGNTVIGAWNRGGQVQDASGSGIHGLEIVDNMFDGAVEGLSFSGTSGSVNLFSITAKNNTFRNISGANGAIFLQNWYSANIEDNKIDTSASYGIFCYQCGPLNIRGNAINGVQYSGIRLETCTNSYVCWNLIGSNNIANNSSPAIYMLAQNVAEVNFNTFRQPGTEYYAVRALSTGNDVEIRYNSVLYTPNVIPLYRNDTTTANTFGQAFFSAKTITTPGTTGAQTINYPNGRVNIAAGQSSITVTDNLVTANSTVLAVAAGNDATAVVKNVVPSGGSFTITLSAAATAETPISFWVLN